MPFVFDTNSFRVLQNYYPTHFQAFWAQFDALVTGGDVLSVREVLRELEQQVTKEWFQQWIDRNKGIFLTPDNAETEYVKRIFSVRHFQGLVAQKAVLKGTPVADPFVVACAGVRGATVVTEETLRPNAAKIPNVCQYFGIHCTDLEGLFRDLGWQF